MSSSHLSTSAAHTPAAQSAAARARIVAFILFLLACLTATACGGGGATAPTSEEPATGAPTEPPAPAPTVPQQPPAQAPAQPPAQAPAPTPPAPAPTPAPAPPAAPSTATVSTAGRAFSPNAVTIAAGGSVTWQMVDDEHTVTFVAAAPPGGSIPRTAEGASVSRTFPAAGSYDYECLRHRDKGMRGTVTVTEAPSTPPPAAPAPPPATPPSPAPTPPAPAPPSPPASAAATVTTPNATFSPAAVTIPSGGTVTWQFSEARHNVTFQGTAPAGGNIPDTSPGASASRTFTAPGTYNYLCTRHSGMSGRVIVQ